MTWPNGVAIDHTEFPEDWFEGLHPDHFLASRYVATRNKYGVSPTQLLPRQLSRASLLLCRMVYAPFMFAAWKF